MNRSQQFPSLGVENVEELIVVGIVGEELHLRTEVVDVALG